MASAAAPAATSEISADHRSAAASSADAPVDGASAEAEDTRFDSGAAAISSSGSASNDQIPGPETSAARSDSPEIPSASRKNGGTKDRGHSIRYSVNKSAAQFKKSPHRKSASPLNWFPRKKSESFLMRKIRHLQEVDGLKLSLDETLGNANPHYTRMTREKIAAREAARKAIEARKAAMIEGSWCRILQAARIHSKEAEVELEKAKKYEAETFEAARATGVMLFDRPDCPRQPREVASSSAIDGGSTHTVTASLETAFEVDKEVAAAVKEAFIWLANCLPYSNKEEFRDLLRKISENPDTKTDQEIVEQSEFDTLSDWDQKLHHADFRGDDAVNKQKLELKMENHTIGRLASTMLDRLKGLQEDELASLAIIVATCGLNALLQVESSRYHDRKPVTSCHVGRISLSRATKRNYGRSRHVMDGHMEGEEVGIELPSLDKFLVKHVSRLEREVQEARNSKKNNAILGHPETSEASRELPDDSRPICSNNMSASSDTTADLGNILVNNVSKLEREIEEVKIPGNDNSASGIGENIKTEITSAKATGRESPVVPTQHVGGIPINCSPEIEQKIAEEIHDESLQPECTSSKDSLNESVPSFDLAGQYVKENTDINALVWSSTSAEKLHELDGKQTECGKKSPVKHVSRIERAKLEALKAFSSLDERNEKMEPAGLDKILVKSVHRLEREKMQASLQGNDYDTKINTRKQLTEVAASEGLDKILVKHVSRLEKERQALGTREDVVQVKKRGHQVENMEGLGDILVKHQPKSEKAKMAAVTPVDAHSKVFSSLDGRKETDEPPGLDKILVKSVHWLEKEKMQASVEGSDYDMKRNITKQVTDVAASEGLDKILVKHVSRLEKEKMSLGTRIDAVKVKKRDHQVENMESLGDILVKHQPKPEKVKVDAVTKSENHIKHVDSRTEARQKELQASWGGLSLESSIRPHTSRLEREKAAWRRAEEERKGNNRLQ